MHFTILLGILGLVAAVVYKAVAMLLENRWHAGKYLVHSSMTSQMLTLYLF